MKTKKIVLSVLFLSLLLCDFYGLQIKTERQVDDHTVDILFVSPSILKNRIGDTSDGSIRVILPPSYASSDKRYPVIYFLHGYGDSIYQMSGYYSVLSDAFKAGNAGEFIIVNVNGTNRLGGSFYDNSPVTGNWRDFVVKEAVPLVDSKFRTRADRASRGIAGFSMGGYGALNIAFLHPAVFGALWVHAPGLLKGGDLPLMLGQWNSSIRKAYASVYSYNLKNKDNYAVVPAMDGSGADAQIIAAWYSGFGDIPEKVSAYLRQKNRLVGISLNYGSSDMYPWLVKGTQELDAELTAKAVPHTLRVWDGGHTFGASQVIDGMLPFFSGVLKGN